MFVFWEKLLFGNFVSRSTDLYKMPIFQRAGEKEVTPTSISIFDFYDIKTL